MEIARYIVAVLILVTLPPSLLLWFLIHPFARQWRRFGPVWTYAIVSIPAIGLGAALYVARDRLLAVDYGTSYPLVGLAGAFFVATAWIAVQRRRHLTFRILAGIPELTPGEGQPDDGPKLLTEGIYARVRHPRYVEVIVGVLAYALFANHLAIYLLWLVTIPALYAIVVLEERELLERFGEEYEAYRERVPRFVPWSR